jgi:RNA polymerase sigma-70 factor (sigma-E family)
VTVTTTPRTSRADDFDAYVAARRAALVRSAVLMGCSVHDAEDLVQVALATCLPRWGRIVADRPDAYVYRVLVNAFRDSRRRRWTGETPTEELPERSEDPDLTTGLAVRAALATMSHDHREVLVLRYYADLSESETAEVLGVPAGTVTSRTSRARAARAARDHISRTR